MLKPLARPASPQALVSICRQAWFRRLRLTPARVVAALKRARQTMLPPTMDIATLDIPTTDQRHSPFSVVTSVG